MENVTSKMQNVDGRKVTRRSFVTGAAAAGIVAGAAATAGAALADDAAGIPQTWDEECEILILGYGAAGLAAAITAAEEGLGDALVLEAAPEEYTGGNFRCAGQVTLTTDNPEGLVEYQTALNGAYVVAPGLMDAWGQDIAGNLEWLTSIGADMVATNVASPEFADFPSSDSVQCYLPGGTRGMGALWEWMHGHADEDGVRVLYGTRARSLVFDPATKEVFGVRAEKEDGGEVAVKASKGVVVACGGFENDPDLIRENSSIGQPRLGFYGTPYNRGDSIRMARQIGARLWHMNNFAGVGAPAIKANGDHSDVSAKLRLGTKSFIYVAGDAKRFMREEDTSLVKHGKILRNGNYIQSRIPDPAWAIFDQACYDKYPIVDPDSFNCWLPRLGLLENETNDDYLAAGVIVKADTAEELAEAIGLDPEALAQTVEEYNGYAAQGYDPDFHRGEAVYQTGAMDSLNRPISSDEPVIDAFDLVALEGPLYAVKISANLINTQGGAERDVNGQIVDNDGNPIPRLFGAGEFGCVYSFIYNGGGNVGEAFASARKAVRNIAALDAWE